MTCREFKHSASSLTMWELTRARDERILSHAEECGPCGAWLQQQRTLAASMQALQASTAGQEAGPNVERALLQAFRQATPTNAAVPALSSTAEFAVTGTRTAKVEAGERNQPLRPIAMPRSTPVALRLSRFFEIGAYAAVAAAILVGTFLGVRLLQDRHPAAPMQSHNLPAKVEPVAHRAAADPAQNPVPKTIAETPIVTGEVQPVTLSRKRLQTAPAPESASTSANSNAQDLTEATYTPLMLCDPLSCAAETQVVRVELPANGQSSQPQMADLVVGYDGVVRAVRMVN